MSQPEVAPHEVIVHLHKHKEETTMQKYGPWTMYKKGMAIGFSVTFAVNMVSGLCDTSELSLYRNPISFVGITLGKSLFYSLFFPAIPIKMLFAPRSYFILGGGASQYF